MDAGTGKVDAAATSFQVPDELMRELHMATDRFSSAKRHLDSVLDSRGATVREKEAVGEEIRNAQRALEQVSEKIHGALHA